MSELPVVVSRITLYPLAFALGYPAVPVFGGNTASWTVKSDRDLGCRILFVAVLQASRRNRLGVATAPLVGLLSLGFVRARV